MSPAIRPSPFRKIVSEVIGAFLAALYAFKLSKKGMFAVPMSPLEFPNA